MTSKIILSTIIFIASCLLFFIPQDVVSAKACSNNGSIDIDKYEGTTNNTSFVVSGRITLVKAGNVPLQIIDANNNPVTGIVDATTTGGSGERTFTYTIPSFGTANSYSVNIKDYIQAGNSTQVVTVCQSDPIVISSPPTPTPDGISTPAPTPKTTCSPPGTKGVLSRECNDPDCELIGSQCIVKGTVILPTQTRPTTPPTPKITPPCKDLNEDGTCKSFPTAIGNIDTDPIGFIKRLFGLLLGISGGIAVILIIMSGYQLMVSQGNKEAVQAARERITSAIVGLLFLIFSLVILQIIGVDILSIPGFSAR